MTNSHSRGPISVAARVNIRYTLKSNIQHITLLGDFQRKLLGGTADRGEAQEQNEAREKFQFGSEVC